MKNLQRIFIFLVIVLTFSNVNKLNAQFDFSSIMKAGTDDAGLYLEKWTAPMSNMLGASLNNGWYNTGEPHKLGGFDLTLTFSGSLAPASSKTFNFNELNTKLIKMTPGADPNLPTITGGDLQSTQTATFNIPPAPPQKMDLLSGVNLPMLGLPMIQLGIGLPKKSTIMFRFIPKINLGDIGSFNLWGVGLNHEFKQWIPVMSALPFNLSFIGGYTSMTLQGKVSENDALKPTVSTGSASTGIIISNDPTNNINNPKYLEQGLKYSISAINANVVISKSLLFFTPYLGVGVNYSKATTTVTGIYPVLTGYDLINNKDIYQNTAENPINFATPNFSPRVNLGFRLKFFIFTFHADYTLANYSAFTAGMGFSFR